MLGLIVGSVLLVGLALVAALVGCYPVVLGIIIIFLGLGGHNT